MSDPLPLLRLYPARYRAAHGQEITAVFADATEEGGRRAVLREGIALAAHAMRLRTRLSSGDPAGRIAAGAAPFALAGAASLCLLYLLPDHFAYAYSGWRLRQYAVAISVAQTAPWILALLCATLGRWTLTRALVLLATAVKIVTVTGLHHLGDSADAMEHGFLWLWIVLGAVLLAAPPDLVVLSRRGRSEIALSTLAITLPLLPAAQLVWPLAVNPRIILPSWALAVMSSWPAIVLAVAMLVHLATLGSDRVRSVGIGLTALPWAVMFLPYGWRRPGLQLLQGFGGILLLLGIAVTAAGVVRALRRAREADPA